MKRFALTLVALGALTLFGGSTAKAQGIGYGYGGYRYSGPVYHGPSVHYHRSYHPTYSHWTPYRGWHTHGHYHVTPHYTPGHFDHQHGNHIHGNPAFHW